LERACDNSVETRFLRGVASIRSQEAHLWSYFNHSCDNWQKFEKKRNERKEEKKGLFKSRR
jgi:hypothetical protein